MCQDAALLTMKGNINAPFVRYPLFASARLVLGLIAITGSSRRFHQICQRHQATDYTRYD